MDDERLADLLAGELTPDEQAAVEAELAGDAVLRARLARMRAADEALGGLSTPAPRDGFEERLHAAVAPEVARTVGGDAGEELREAGAGDELAARRAGASRTRPRWPLALGGVAAGLALLAVVGISLSGLPAGPDEADVALDADEEGAEAVDDGPALLATDRDLDDEAVAELFDDPHLTGVAARRLDDDAGRRLAEAYRARFADDDAMLAASRLTGTSDAATAGEDAPQAEADGPVDDAASGDGAAPAGRPDADARADMRRCLATLLDDGLDLVPAYAEASTYEGEPVVVFGLLGPGPDTQRYDRLEVWVLERDDCQVRTFQQRDP